MQNDGRTTYLEDTSVKALVDALDCLQDAGKKTALIFACASNNYSADELSPALQASEMTIIGATFPSIVVAAELYESGVLIISYDEEIPATVFRNISHCDTESIAEKIESQEQHNLLVLADALCGGMDLFIENLYQHLGIGIQVIGGGAGALDFVERPCIFSNQGLLQNAAIVAYLPNTLKTACGHGWEILDGPYLITECDGHDIISINYQPAFDFYRDTLRELNGKELTENKFFEVVMDHPLGISGLHGEILVRDPIVTNDGKITCVGNIPQNATVFILQGNADNLIDAARETSQLVLGDCAAKQNTTLLFDCISRQLYLSERVTEELSCINENIPEGQQMVGVFSLGELGNHQGGPIQLMNKSLVLGCF